MRSIPSSGGPQSASTRSCQPLSRWRVTSAWAQRRAPHGMSFSDSEAGKPARPLGRRPRSAPCRPLPVLDLDEMTKEAVELFQSGQQQAALDLAVNFAREAEALLGKRHPIHVNCLATVAAFAEQMGCREEAQELLEEAEELHEAERSESSESRSLESAETESQAGAEGHFRPCSKAFCC